MINVPFSSYITPHARSIARLWARLLKVDEATIQPTSDFFDLGGHSLLLAKLSAALLKDMGLVVAIPSIIERPTLGELAELLDSQMTSQKEASGGAPSTIILSTPALRYRKQRIYSAAKSGERGRPVGSTHLSRYARVNLIL